MTNTHKTHHYALLIFSILIFLIAFFIVAFEFAYAYKIFPRTYVGDVELTSKNKNQAVEILTKKIDPITTSGLSFLYKDERVNIDSIIVGPTSGDVYEEIFSYDVQETVNRAYDYGHLGNWFRRFKEQFNSVYKKNFINPRFRLNEEGLKEILRDNFYELEKPAVDADLQITVLKNKNIEVSITEEESGQIIDYDKAIASVKENLNNFKTQDIILNSKIDEPKIKSIDVQKNVPLIEEVLGLAPIVFNYSNNEWSLSRVELASWIKLNKDNGEVKVEIDKEEAENFLANIAVDIDIEARDSKFEISNGRVTKFQSSRSGLEVNIEKTIEDVANKILNEKINVIEILVEETEPQVKNGDVNDLGIVELLGRGISDFSGSPPNRIHNITNGANRLGGLVIKPGDTFSLIDALGEIDGENGYKQELVIKGNKTIPEYGGGLCQIGTTTFRAALQAGLPIIERRNHSYNVSYYAPTGTDATIYSPKPDMRFKNDTENHILFITRVEGMKLVFELWGTKDGRSVLFKGKEETSDFTKLTPIVYNIVSPGEPKYIETEDLEPGEKKRLEHSHKGSDATFDYVVTYGDGKVKEKTFESHYVPWREVWLIGVEEKEESEDVEGGDSENNITTEEENKTEE